jgi:hypothetical protein
MPDGEDYSPSDSHLHRITLHVWSVSLPSRPSALLPGLEH